MREQSTNISSETLPQSQKWGEIENTRYYMLENQWDDCNQWDDLK